MWIVTTRIQLRPDQFADAVASYRTLVAPRVVSTTGSIGAALLLNETAAAAESVSYWPGLECLSAHLLAAGTVLEDGWLEGAARAVPACYRVALLWRDRPLAPGASLRSIEVRCPPPDLDRYLRYVQGDFEPGLRSLDGYRSLLCGIDDPGGRVIVSSSWDTQQHMAVASAQIEVHENRLLAAIQANAFSLETSILAVVAAGEPG